MLPYRGRPAPLFPLNFEEADLSIVTLTGCTSNHELRERLTEACNFLQTDSKAASTIQENANAINKSLEGCLQEGWIRRTNKIVFGEYKPAKGEFMDKRWPNDILTRVQDPRHQTPALVSLRHQHSGRAPAIDAAQPPLFFDGSYRIRLLKGKEAT
jgi:hypothetical protein